MDPHCHGIPGMGQLVPPKNGGRPRQPLLGLVAIVQKNKNKKRPTRLDLETETLVFFKERFCWLPGVGVFLMFSWIWINLGKCGSGVGEVYRCIWAEVIVSGRVNRWCTHQWVDLVSRLATILYLLIIFLLDFSCFCLVFSALALLHRPVFLCCRTIFF